MARYLEKGVFGYIWYMADVGLYVYSGNLNFECISEKFMLR